MIQKVSILMLKNDTDSINCFYATNLIISVSYLCRLKFENIEFIFCFCTNLIKYVSIVMNVQIWYIEIKISFWKKFVTKSLNPDFGINLTATLQIMKGSEDVDDHS